MRTRNPAGPRIRTLYAAAPMGGSMRYLLAGAILSLLALLFAVRPDEAGLIKVKSRPLVQSLHGKLAEIGRLVAGSNGQEPPKGDHDLALLALRGKPLELAFVAEVPDAVSQDSAWRQGMERRIASSPLFQIDPGGAPLTLEWRPEDRVLSLSLPMADVVSSTDEDGVTQEPLVETGIPSFEGLVPPFLIILLAVLFARTIPALLAGVLLGAMLAVGPIEGLWHFARDYVWTRVLFEKASLKILGFVLMLAASIGIMTRSGGIEGMVELVKRLARSARSSQLVTWLMGLLIFFDDYANSIVVGSTMRPLTDRLRVSREKLAYIVDSTAAPVAGLALLSTWIVTEISYFEPTLRLVYDESGNALYKGQEGFAIFLETIPFRFYCFLTLFMVSATILLKREFGPMLAAERRARHEGKPIADGARPMIDEALTKNQAKEHAPRLWWNGILPILTLVSVTVFEIWRTGASGAERGRPGFWAHVRAIIGNADSSWAIFLGASMSALLAAVLSMMHGIMRPLECLVTGIRSMRALFFALAILVLAWCIGFVCEDLETNYYLIAMTEGGFRGELLPTILFLVSCLVAFATGSSWSTMAILLPNVVLLAHSQLGQGTEYGGHVLMVLSIGAVLEGSIFGDHCSPISDTTVLSSVGSGSDHLDHVRTQAPYALLVMLVTLAFGYLPVAYLSPELWPVSMLAGASFIAGFLLLLGRDPDRPASR